jgi:hypothetical protein
MDLHTILSIAIATGPTMLVVLIGILNNNHRLDDFKDLFQSDLKRVKDTTRLELRRIEESLLHKFAELNDRLVRLENRFGA